MNTLCVSSIYLHHWALLDIEKHPSVPWPFLYPQFYDHLNISSPTTISISPVLWPFQYPQSHDHFNIRSPMTISISPSPTTISISAVARPFQYPKFYDHFNIPQSHDHFNIPSPMTISKSLLVKLCWTFVFNWLHTCLECLCSAEYVVVCLNMNSDCAIQILMSVNSRCAAWNCLSFCSFSLMIWILILNFSLILFE